MKATITKLMSLLLVLSVTTFGQWAFDKNFPDDTSLVKGSSTGGHGIAVDPAGKVWVQLYGATESVPGSATKTRVLYVYNPDGTPASFSPIKMLTVGGVTDTLWNSGRGGTPDNMGNPVFAFFDKLYKIKYQDGTGMKTVVPIAGQTACAPAFDDEGYMYTSQVLPGYPVKIFDADYNFLSNAVDTAADYARTTGITPDGLTLFVPRFGLKKVLIYTRGSKFDPFVFSDSLIFKGAMVESFCIHPVTKHLWFSAGSYFDMPTDPKWSTQTWYAYDYISKTIKDSLKWKDNVAGNVNERPRAIGFSPDGRTAYVTAFGASDYPAVQKHIKTGSFVQQENSNVIKGFVLEQNYPNPFNPDTKIKFSLVQEGFVTLNVYNAVGQIVETLVNEKLAKGNYSVNFVGKNLPSGTYIYEMTTSNQRIAKKMLLVK